jgi:multimeric flavodoxin WrbA
VYFNKQKYSISVLSQRILGIFGNLRRKHRNMKNILVINGSPKGKYSVTLHTVLYLQKQFPEYNFEILHASQKIKSLEKDFSPALEAIRKADLLIFAYPVYTFLVPAQLHRFIELMHESGEDFSSKTATQITTSKHFYDTTAHEFIRENCQDLNMYTLEGLSADMDDILTKNGQTQAVKFFKYTLWQMGETFLTSFKPERQPRIAVVTDYSEEDWSLIAKIETFKKEALYPVDIINIREFPFKGSCISCFNCASDGECIYKDGFTDLLRNDIHRHNAIVYAFTIRNHSMGSLFKMYDDRQFCNGHRTVTMGTPFGYIIEGDIEKEQNLKTVLTARAQVGGNFLAGLACTDDQVFEMAHRLVYAISNQLVLPQNFLGVGGMKIFRDLIYLMRGMMRADHKFFKSHGQYDFPQKKWATSMKMYLVGWLMGNKKLKSKMGNQLNEGMISEYKKILDK